MLTLLVGDEFIVRGASSLAWSADVSPLAVGATDLITQRDTVAHRPRPPRRPTVKRTKTSVRFATSDFS